MAEKDKIYVDAEEYARLCRQDGKMDSLIAFMRQEDKNCTSTYSDREVDKDERLTKAIQKAKERTADS